MKTLNALSLNLFLMFPLQLADFSDFNLNKSSGDSQKQLIVFIVLMVVIIGGVVVLGSLRKNTPGAGASKGGAAGGFFSGLALHRMARDMGLNRDQIKMLDFVFKTDDVIDPHRSIVTPDLLDRHFRRAYRVIEQSAGSQEDIQHRIAVLFSTRNTLEHAGGSGITSTRQLREDATLTIGSGKDKHEVSVVSTKGDNLAVECPKNALGSLIKIPKGNRITVFAFSKGNNKGLSFETRVSGYSGSMGHTVMLLAHSTQIKRLSQRRYRRRQAVIACNMFLVYVEGSGRKQRLIVEKRRLTGNIADISVGGCSIKSRAPIQVGAKMKIEFVQGDINVAALGQVLRTNRAGIVTVVHVKFLKVSRKSMNAINAFVYEFVNE